ncbi:MAG: DUF3604 domain-containing protein [Flavobacteriales bacterium]|nr:DUF3604 domain-containing protein [Flavobacteriales bacterium]
MTRFFVFSFFATIIISGCKSHHKPIPNLISDRATLSKDLDISTIETNPNKNLYWGDLHVHTSLSFDAFFSGTLTSCDEAYRYAQGEEIEIYGRKVKLRKPLDFCAITDHSELLGESYCVTTEGAPGHNSLVNQFFRSIFNTDSPLGVDTAKQWSIFKRTMKGAEKASRTHPFFFKGYETTATAWGITIDAAEKHYQPGKFTTLMGFEWTLANGRSHLHRNVIFRDMMLPAYPVSSLEARNEEELWTWMQQSTDAGASLLAIPHNTNLAEGSAFRSTDIRGNPISKEYAQMRQDFERLVEVHQVKGNSEVHPAFWKNDEFAGFENHTFGEPNETNYVRYGLKKGVQFNQQLGVNPFKLGMIGSTDTHNGTPGNTEEDDKEIGNKGIIDIDPVNRTYDRWPLDMTQRVAEVVNPGGLVAVWAEANTRGHIYDALQRREVFATSGNRIQLRFFGGNGFNPSLNEDQMLSDAYQKGVPMGNDLKNPNEKPQFLVWAKRDEDGATLDRIQIIKGWADENGAVYEEIFDVALSDGRKLNADGSVPDNGAVVNLTTGEWSKDKGAEELKVIWTDEDFNPKHHSFYYVRVLEVPTASWRLWDMIRYGSDFSKEKNLVIQERAWSSPIWYSPN